MQNYLQSIESVHLQLLDQLQSCANLVSSFKQISVDQSREELDSICLYRFLQKVMLCLKQPLAGVELFNEIDPHMVIDSYSAPWSQIFVHLIQNTLQHNDKEQLQIRVQGNVADKLLTVIYTDNGFSLPESVMLNLFQPYIHEKDVGLGLYTVHQLVKNVLKGDVRANTNQFYGLELIITVPLGAY